MMIFFTVHVFSAIASFLTTLKISCGCFVCYKKFIPFLLPPLLQSPHQKKKKPTPTSLLYSLSPKLFFFSHSSLSTASLTGHLLFTEPHTKATNPSFPSSAPSFNPAPLTPKSNNANETHFLNLLTHYRSLQSISSG